MIPASEIGPGDTMFTMFDDKTGEQTDFAVERLRSFCEANLPVRILAVTKEHAHHIMLNRGIEQHRLDRLTVEACVTPLIFCHFNKDDSWMLVDGSHRYVKIALAYGGEECMTYMVEEEQWRPFTVKGARKRDPDELLNSFSGIT